MKKDKTVYEKDAFKEDLIRAVKEDFKRRRDERKDIERQWQLNLNYLSGNQYCEITARGEVEEEEKYYFWQNRNAYNHIAPIIDARISKLTAKSPVMSVRAAGAEEADVKTAKLTTALLNSTFSRIDVSDAVHRATLWSETCGTAFYEVSWDGFGGKYLGETDGKKVYEGDVKVEVVSPFEIFPDSLCAERLDDCESVIRARAMRVKDVKAIYGVDVKGEDVDVFSVAGGDSGKTVLHDATLVIEKFERPSELYPGGRLTAVAGDELLYTGELPYVNGAEGRREYPFIKQVSITKAGSFFGSSVIERLIPVQRSYNAVKNRKQEFMNRLSMSVVAVEDGSVDADELAEEGLSPGKIIVYRQGSRPPQVVGVGSIPSELIYEEERLMNEFILISGVSEFSRNSAVNSNLSSGTALQLLIEQDDARLSSVTDNLKRAVKSVAKHTVRLFKQFAAKTRLLRVAGDAGKVELYYFDKSDISSDDVTFDSESEFSYTPVQKKTAIYELVNAGILSDATGKMSERTKAKILEILGFGSIDNALDVESLQINRAESENVTGFAEAIPVEDYDDDEIHVTEHTRYLLSAESAETRADAVKKQNALAHLKEHKDRIAARLSEKDVK